MSWSAPMTAVAGATFSAAEFNQYVRDNLNSTAVALATTASQVFVSTGVNALVARVPANHTVITSQTTSSSSYTNLATVGPLVTTNTGTIALVWFGAAISCNVANTATVMSVEVTGASTVAANDQWAVTVDGVTAANSFRASGFHVFTGLTAGSNTFRARYRCPSGNTGTYAHREIAVFPL